MLSKVVFQGDWQRVGGNRTEKRRNPNTGLISGKVPQKTISGCSSGDTGVYKLYRAVTEARELGE